MAACACLFMWLATGATADDWMTRASSYTHDQLSAQRVDQYALPEQPLGPGTSAVHRSGYRNYRSTLQAGQSADNYHLVEEFGNQVIPYEQWRFPYRPYAVPYDAWGPQAPYGIYNGQFGYGQFGYGQGGYYGGNPGRPGAGLPGTPGVSPGGIPPFARTPAEILPGTGIPPGFSGRPGDYYGPGGQIGPSRGFPLQPQYLNQPWYDGTYPAAPPIDQRPDAAFFYHPPLGRAEQPGPSIPPVP